MDIKPVEKVEAKKTEVVLEPLVKAEPVKANVESMKKTEQPVVEEAKPTKKPTEPAPAAYLPMFSSLLARQKFSTADVSFCEAGSQPGGLLGRECPPLCSNISISLLKAM